MNLLNPSSTPEHSEETGPEGAGFPEEPLTTREREIAFWVAQGKTNPQIAQHLGVSTRTVTKHLENIYRKLGIRNRVELAIHRFHRRPPL